MGNVRTNVWDYREELRTQANASDYVGYDVEALDGHIGKIDATSKETSRHYVVVDTGWWIFGKKRMIPAGVITRADHDEKRLWVSMTKDQIKSAPDYDADELARSGDVYRDKVGGYYSGYGW